MRDRDKDIEQLFHEAVLIHPTEEELGEYHDAVMDEVAQARISAHLRCCPTCAKQYEMMKEILATYPDVEVPLESSEELKKLAARMLPSQAISASAIFVAITGMALLQGSRIRLSVRGARAAGQRQIHDGQTEDGILRWRIEEEAYGDLVVRLGSDHLELKGFKLTLRAGSISKEVVLTPKALNQVGGETRIDFKERTQLPEKTELVIERITPPETTSR